jgi:group I intron endonuclease
MREDFVVYLHERLDTNAVFYVGKGTAKRVRQKCNRNPHWHRIVAKAGGFNDHLVATGLVESEALELEKLLIAEMRQRGIEICNMTDGGDGISGYHFSDEVRKAMSERMKQKTPFMQGKEFSEEHRQKLRMAKLGKKQSQKHIDASTAGKLGRTCREETKKKIADALKGRKTPQHIVAKNFKPVICTTNGILYESVTSAAKSLSLQTSNISKCCKGILKQTGGYSFKYTTSSEGITS